MRAGELSGVLTGAAALALFAPGEARAQLDGCPGLSQPSPNCTTTTSSFEYTFIFLPADVTIVRNTVYSTRIIGRLLGGTPLYEQLFAAAFTDPAAQGGIAAARAAIANSGGPGVIIAGPMLTQRSVSSTTVQGPSIYSVAGNNAAPVVTEAIGPTTIQIGDVSGCSTALTTLPSPVRPVCSPNPTSYVVVAGSNNFNLSVVGTYSIAETRTDTISETIAETWELNGTVVAIGTIHAAVQSALFDQSGRLLARLPERGAGGWGEGYAMRVRHGDRRVTRGLAGGFGIAVARGLILGFGADHGSSDIDVLGAMEEGEVRLTEIGATLRLERGPFSAALSGVYGFGSAETLRTIAGSSRASYDLRVAGASLEIGYAVEAGGWSLRPVAGIDHVRIETDGFTESDTLGLLAADHDADRLRASAGLEVGRRLGEVDLAASARYVAILDGGERTLPVAFAVAPGTPLLMTGFEEGDSALIGARARIPLATNAELTLGYDGRFGRGYDGHAAFAGLSVRW